LGLIQKNIKFIQMKNLVLIVLFLIAVPSIAQNVSDKKMALFTKTTATWCINCGTWGWTLFDDVYLEETLPKFVSVKLHSSSSSDLYSPDANELVQRLNIPSGQPRFGLNLQPISASSSTSSSAASLIGGLIYSTSQLNADINAGFTLDIMDNNEITVQTKTKVFNAINGEYYLGVYLTEKDIVNSQAGQGENAVHKIILRNALTEDVMGDLIDSGDLEAGAEFDNSYSFSVPTEVNTDNIQVFLVVWKKVGEEYIYESAFTKTQEEEEEVVNGISDISSKFDFNIGNENGQSFYRINAVESNQNLEIGLYNSNGQLVQSLFEGTITNEVSGIISSTDLPKGIYFVRAVVGNKTKTLKIIL